MSPTSILIASLAAGVLLALVLALPHVVSRFDLAARLLADAVHNLALKGTLGPLETGKRPRPRAPGDRDKKKTTRVVWA